MKKLLDGSWEYVFDPKRSCHYLLIRIPKTQYEKDGFLYRVIEECLIYEGTPEWDLIHALKHKGVAK